MQCNDKAPDELVCFCDDVSVSAEDPRCLHPSGFCRFRDFCRVLEAMRRKRRSDGGDDPD